MGLSRDAGALPLPAAAGGADTPEVTLETDPQEEDFLARLPAQPGGLSRVFFSPNWNKMVKNKTIRFHHLPITYFYKSMVLK